MTPTQKDTKMTDKRDHARQGDGDGSTLLPMLLVGLALMTVGMFVVIFFV